MQKILDGNYRGHVLTELVRKIYKERKFDDVRKILLSNENNFNDLVKEFGFLLCGNSHEIGENFIFAFYLPIAPDILHKVVTHGKTSFFPITRLELNYGIFDKYKPPKNIMEMYELLPYLPHLKRLCLRNPHLTENEIKHVCQLVSCCVNLEHATLSFEGFPVQKFQEWNGEKIVELFGELSKIKTPQIFIFVNVDFVLFKDSNSLNLVAKFTDEKSTMILYIEKGKLVFSDK